MECHQGQVPEILWFRPRPGGILARQFSSLLQTIPYFKEIARKLLFGQWGIIDLYALTCEPKVRGGVKADLEVGFGLLRIFSGVLGEDCGDECGG